MFFFNVRRYLNQRLDFSPIWVSYHGLWCQLSTGCLANGYPPAGEFKLQPPCSTPRWQGPIFWPGRLFCLRGMPIYPLESQPYTLLVYRWGHIFKLDPGSRYPWQAQKNSTNVKSEAWGRSGACKPYLFVILFREAECVATITTSHLHQLRLL